MILFLSKELQKLKKMNHLHQIKKNGDEFFNKVLYLLFSLALSLVRSALQDVCSSIVFCSLFRMMSYWSLTVYHYL